MDRAAKTFGESVRGHLNMLELWPQGKEEHEKNSNEATMDCLNPFRHCSSWVGTVSGLKL